MISKKEKKKRKSFCAKVVTTNGFAVNNDKSLQIYFICVKRQAKNDFLKDGESTVHVVKILKECTANNKDAEQTARMRRLVHFWGGWEGGRGVGWGRGGGGGRIRSSW